MTDFAPSVQLNNETLDFFTESLELDQSVFPKLRMKSRLKNAESSVHPEPKNVQSNSVPKLIVARNVLFHGSCVFWFLAERDDDASDDENGDKVFVLVSSMSFCVSFDGSEFSPIHTSSVFDFRSLS